MGSLSFTSLSFLVAGAVCAAGPLIIHLLNRRRFRTIEWAAMDFLRQALQTHLDQATQLLADYTGESFRKSR